MSGLSPQASSPPLGGADRRKAGGHVVGRTKAPVTHFHVARFGIGGTRPRLLGLGALGPLRDLAAANAAAMRSSRSCAAGARRFPSPGSALHLGLDGRHQFARFAQVLLQARLSPKRAGPGRRTDPHPVLRYPLQADRPHRRQCRHVVRERFIHQRFVAGAKVVEGEVVHRHPATDPPIRVVLQTKPRHFAPAAHPLKRGVEPQCKQDTRVDRHPTGIAAPRLDRLDQPAQVLSAPRSPTPIVAQ